MKGVTKVELGIRIVAGGAVGSKKENTATYALGGLGCGDSRY